MDNEHKNMLQQCSGFDWDDGNIDKNWLKHGVTPLESEQIFFNQPLLVGDDAKHSEAEKRYFALGKTDLRRFLLPLQTNLWVTSGTGRSPSE